MNQDERDRLEAEVALSHKARVAYDNFLEPFFASKRKTLFNNFCEASMSEVDTLLEAKRLVKVVDQMEEEILEIITTGKLAAKTLGVE